MKKKLKNLFLLSFLLTLSLSINKSVSGECPKDSIEKISANPSLPINEVYISASTFTSWYNDHKNKKLMLEFCYTDKGTTLIGYGDKFLNNSAYEENSSLRFEIGARKTITSTSNDLLVGNLKLGPKKIKLISKKIAQEMKKNSDSIDYYQVALRPKLDPEKFYLNYDVIVIEYTKEKLLAKETTVTAADPSPPATNKK